MLCCVELRKLQPLCVLCVCAGSWLWKVCLITMCFDKKDKEVLSSCVSCEPTLGSAYFNGILGYVGLCQMPRGNKGFLCWDTRLPMCALSCMCISLVSSCGWVIKVRFAQCEKCDRISICPFVYWYWDQNTTRGIGKFYIYICMPWKFVDPKMKLSCKA